jgi:hypothetical protein
MREFESKYRISEGDDVLNKENSIHQSLDLRLDAVEQLGEAFAAGNRAAVDAILRGLNETFTTLAAQTQELLSQVEGGLTADVISETASRYFLTDDRRASILTDLRGGVVGDADTLSKLLAYVVGGAPAGRQTLKMLNDAVVANSTAISVITNGADPSLDSFAEALTRFVNDEGQVANLMSSLGTRLRFDGAQSLTPANKVQALNNLGVSTFIQTLLDDPDRATAIGTILGFTPVQQGGGFSQQSSRMRFGWDGSRPRLTVDDTDVGQFWMNNDAPLVTVTGTSGYQKLPSGLIVQWTAVDMNNSGDVQFSWPVSFPNALFGHANAIEAGDISANTAWTLKMNDVSQYGGSVRARVTSGGSTYVQSGVTIARLMAVGY